MTLWHSSAMSAPLPSCVRHTSKVAPPSRLPWPSFFSQIRPHSGRGSGAVKSLSSLVIGSSCWGPGEVRVCAMNDVMHGVFPCSNCVRFTPNSVKAFFSSVVISLPWRS